MDPGPAGMDDTYVDRRSFDELFRRAFDDLSTNCTATCAPPSMGRAGRFMVMRSSDRTPGKRTPTNLPQQHRIA
jgi:hypothetical protein